MTESMTTKKVWLADRQMDGQTDAGQNYLYVTLCFAGVIKNRSQLIKTIQDQQLIVAMYIV